jgi:hypothetical protein
MRGCGLSQESVAKGTEDARSSLVYDQRGLPYPRLHSMSNLTDICAYEVQQDDAVFNAALEGRATIPNRTANNCHQALVIKPVQLPRPIR